MNLIFAPHKIDYKSPQYQDVEKAMITLGAPTIRVIDCVDYYGAIEGSHRLAAAEALGLVPYVQIMNEDDIVEHDLQDLQSPCAVRDIANYLTFDQACYNYRKINVI